MQARDRLDLKATLVLTGLCMLWGLGGVAIKISNEGMAPVFTAGVRSLISSLALIVWMKSRGMPLFQGRVLDGLGVGLLFGLEFCLLYSSLLYTTASSAWILLYTTPFFHALGAHTLLSGDRLSRTRLTGLVLAFVGVIVLLSKHASLPSPTELLGDLLAMGAAVFWAATTILIKRRLVGQVSPFHTLFYQTLFSAPVLFATSALLGEVPVRHMSLPIFGSLLFQGLGVAFLSYLVWFFLVHAYPVSRLTAFTFLTPVFATMAGVLFLGEALTLRIVLSLALVSLGIYVVNRG